MRVGDYIRTNDGYINKIISLSEWNVVVEAKILIGEKLIIAKTEIIKSSPNIIDLIEVGDYVNGCEVLEICNYGNFDSHLIVNGNGFNVIMLEDIKSIVTKEQFEQMEYRIGE